MATSRSLSKAVSDRTNEAWTCRGLVPFGRRETNASPSAGGQVGSLAAAVRSHGLKDIDEAGCRFASASD